MLSPRAKMILIPMVILSFMVSGVSGLLTVTYNIENQAQVVGIGIGVYWDLTSTLKCDSINWGSLRPGESKTVTVYVKNTGGYAITGSIAMSNWDPSTAANYISLQWDFGTTPLLPGRVRTVQFTLTVSPSIQGITNFYFTITVTGTQYTG